MSIFDKQKPKEETKQRIEAEVKKGLQFIGSRRISRNHILWEFNINPSVLIPATIEQYSKYNEDKAVIKKKANTNDDCQYFGALNRKNAIKKLNKLGIYIIK